MSAIYTFFFCHDCSAPVNHYSEYCPNCNVARGEPSMWIPGTFEKDMTGLFNVDGLANETIQEEVSKQTE